MSALVWLRKPVMVAAFWLVWFNPPQGLLLLRNPGKNLEPRFKTRLPPKRRKTGRSSVSELNITCSIQPYIG